MYKVQELTAPKTLSMGQRDDIKEIPNKSVLLKLKIAGICGSDIEYYKHGYCGAFVPKSPLVLGHEFAGEIVQLGSEVTHLNIGDSVVVDPAMPCYACEYCKTGNSNFCANMKFFGSASCYPHIDGGFGEFVLVPAENCIKFDLNNISWGEAVLVEPLMVALSAVLKLDHIVEKDVVIFGGGTIGQLILSVVSSLGAKSITLVDIREHVCDFALKRGANHALLPQKLKEHAFDVCVEAAGSADALRMCYSVSKKRGTIVQVGTIANEVSIPVNMIMTKELTVKGSFRYKNLGATSLHMIENRRVFVKDVISHVVSFNELQKGFDILLDKSSNAMKVQVAFDKS